MRLDEIRNLVRLLEESEVSEIEVSRWWGGKIRIAKDRVAPSTNGGDPGLSNGAAVHGHAPAAAPPVPAPAPAPEPVATSATLKTINSPMVGTFYRAPAPDADPYVDTGQVIQVGQTVCIIEAMKLMNEIEADVKGRIVEVLVENTQPVEYGQALFRVETA